MVSAVLAIALYAVTLNGTFIYDDRAILLEDPRMTDPSQWSKFLTESYNGGVDRLYRPLVSATYVLQSQLHGDWAMPYHAVNILLNAVASALVALLAFRFAGVRAAWIAGLLFAAHPLHVEATAYIVGRAELMCAIGFLGAMLLYTYPLTNRRAVAIWGCCVFALLSKEQGLFAPAVLPAMWWINRFVSTERYVVDPLTPAERVGQRTLVLLLAWTLAAYITFRQWILPFHWDPYFLDWTINPIKLATGTDRWLMPVTLVGRYAAMLFFPSRLSLDYSGHVIGWHASYEDPYLYVGFVTITVASLLLTLSLFKRKSTPFICLFALGITVGVVSNFTLIGVIFGERLMYLPSAFLILLIAWSLSRTSTRFLAIFLCVVVVLASWRTVSYAVRWNDRVSFYERSLVEQPKSIQLILLLGYARAESGDLDAAEALGVRACETEPEYGNAWLLRSFVAMEKQQWADAQTYLQKGADLELNARVFIYSARLDRLRAATQPSTMPPSTPR